jgi:hypothetical protein
MSYILPEWDFIKIGYTWVMRSNGIFALDNDHYWSKYFVFVRDTVDNCGQIRLKEQSENLHCPYKSTCVKNEKKGRGENEVYGNDNIQPSITGTPIPRQTMGTFSPDVAVTLIYNNDTLTDTWIGHCEF